MEIRCKKCGYVGEAAEVRALPGGVGLVCAQCSHVNPLNLSAEQEKPAGINGTVSQDDLQGVKYLIPASGGGPRCPKCLALITQQNDEERTHCARCGLKITDMERFGPGEAPWEAAPAGKEVEFKQAEQLWPSFDALENGGLDAWSEHVQEHELLDYAVRKLQLQLIETPDSLPVLETLARIERKLQERVFLATTEAELSAEAYSGVVSRLRQRLLAFSLVFWAGILILFGIVFWGKC